MQGEAYAPLKVLLTVPVLRIYSEAQLVSPREWKTKQTREGIFRRTIQRTMAAEYQPFAQIVMRESERK